MLTALCAGSGLAEESSKPYEPVPYQLGRDVVWVPTPPSLIETMLDMAALTPQDVVIDLGSGDGRNVIAAARRGARAHGIEFNPDLVALSRRNAESAGLADRATFAEGDMYEADLSQATVLPLFLLDENLNQLAPKFMQLRPGTRIVNNSFKIDGWEPDEVGVAERDCQRYCTAYLYIVPARVQGTWRMPDGELTLEQNRQMVTGFWSSGGRRLPVENGRLRGDTIVFSIGETRYAGRVTGESMAGEIAGGASRGWSAKKTAASGKMD